MKPVYKASFTLAPEDDFDRIVSTSKEWASFKFKNNPLRGFHQGISVQEPGIYLSTLAAEQDARNLFGMNLIQADSSTPDIQWETIFTVGEKQNSTKQAEVIIANGLKEDSPIRPFSVELRRPNLVPLLIRKFHAAANLPLSLEPIKIGRNNIDNLVSAILSKERKLPLVYASARNFDDKPKVNVPALASELAGIAHVFFAADRFPSYDLAEAIGKSMNCYDGAVRLYWPCTQNYTNPVIHRYWNKGLIDDQFIHTLFGLIADYSVGSRTHLSFEDIRRAKLRQQIKESKKGGDLEELLGIYAQEADSLKKENKSLQDREAQYQEKIRGLTQRVFTLESAVAAYKNNRVEKEPEEIPASFSSVQEAVAKAVEMYPDRLAFSTKARKAFEDSHYQNPEQVFKTLEWFATTYTRMREKGGGNIATSCKEQTGMDYAAHQSPVTMGQFKKDYYIEFEGSKRWFKEHLGHGTGSAEQDSLRIAVDYDKKNRRVIVGYAGVHQKNRR